MKFQIFSFSLNASNTFRDPKQNKNLILKEIIKKEIWYSHHGQKIYLFDKEEEDYIIWAIGRKSTIEKSIIENQSFKKQKEENYPSCKIIFNISEHFTDGGHRIAFEYNTWAFQNPLWILKWFEKSLNKSLKYYGYSISIYPMFDEFLFWDIIQKNNIEKLTFTYSIPNFLKLNNTLSDDLKSIWKSYNTTNAKIELENKNWNLSLDESDQLLKQSVEYCSQWAWTFEVKVKWVRATYSNENSIKTVEIDEINFKWPASLFSKL